MTEQREVANSANYIGMRAYPKTSEKDLERKITNFVIPAKAGIHPKFLYNEAVKTCFCRYDNRSKEVFGYTQEQEIAHF